MGFLMDKWKNEIKNKKFTADARLALKTSHRCLVISYSRCQKKSLGGICTHVQTVRGKMIFCAV
jgi:hypothetical protein